MNIITSFFASRYFRSDLARRYGMLNGKEFKKVRIVLEENIDDIEKAIEYDEKKLKELELLEQQEQKEWGQRQESKKLIALKIARNESLINEENELLKVIENEIKLGVHQNNNFVRSQILNSEIAKLKKKIRKELDFINTMFY